MLVHCLLLSSNANEIIFSENEFVQNGCLNIDINQLLIMLIAQQPDKAYKNQAVTRIENSFFLNNIRGSQLYNAQKQYFTGGANTFLH